MKCFKNANVFLEGRGIIKTNLTFGSVITDTGGAQGDEIKLPSGAVVVPGFIDEHVHGAAGADVMDASFSALSTISKTLAREGTTRYLATTMTQSTENIVRALNAVAEYNNINPKEGASVEGVHLEGPYISERYAGAQRTDYIVNPDISSIESFIKASRNLIKLVTLAPERQGAESAVKYLTERKITVSIGHTAASFRDIEEAVRFGASCFTHTYNAQSGLHHRDVGAVGGALLFDEAATEIIADLIHVSPQAIKLLAKNKPEGKLILITDAMRAKGMGDGTYELGGQNVTVRCGSARLENGALAGSVLCMNQAVKNAVERIGLKFGEAVDAATINPARNLGIDGKCGSIREGKDADFAVLDQDFNVIKTIRGGEIIFTA